MKYRPAMAPGDILSPGEGYNDARFAKPFKN